MLSRVFIQHHFTSITCISTTGLSTSSHYQLSLVLSSTSCPSSTLNLLMRKLLHSRIIVMNNITIANMVKHYLQDTIAVTIFDWDSYCYPRSWCLPVCCSLGAVSIGMTGPGLTIWCDVASVVNNWVSSFTHLLLTNLIHFLRYAYHSLFSHVFGNLCVLSLVASDRVSGRLLWMFRYLTLQTLWGVLWLLVQNQ